jgi:predicted amidohydrolase YtcJ
MTRDEAVRSFTIWNARSVGLAADQGSLEVGRRADLIALPDDVFTCPEERIAGLAPVLTMVGGVVAHGADQKLGASRSASRARSAGSTSDTSA